MRTRIAIGARPDEWIGQTRVGSWQLALDLCAALEDAPPEGHRVVMTSQRSDTKGTRAFVRIVLRQTDRRVDRLGREDVREWIEKAVSDAG